MLLTNDDGIHSKGLACLWESLKGEANLHIAAPMREQSGMGAGVTFRGPLRAEAVNTYANTPSWMIDGTPADCIKLALHKLIDPRPDFILSGINHGSNTGRNALYSGTIGATIEGILLGIPGIAFSYACAKTVDFPHIKPYVSKIFRYVLEHPLPENSILNVNFPHLPAEQIKGCRMARQGYRSWLGTPTDGPHLKQGNHFYLGWNDLCFEEHHESDVFLLEAGYITAVPLMVGELTNYDHLKQKKHTFDAYLE